MTYSQIQPLWVRQGRRGKKEGQGGGRVYTATEGGRVGGGGKRRGGREPGKDTESEPVTLSSDK